MPRNKIIDAALRAATLSDATRVQALIQKAVGGRHERPLGDTWKNLGVFSWTGSVDLKVTEPVTNMQDALIEKLAVVKFGSREAVPYMTPRQAADDLLAGMSYQSVGDMITVSFVESDPPATSTKRLTAIFRDQGVGSHPKRSRPRSLASAPLERMTALGCRAPSGWAASPSTGTPSR